MRMRGAADAGLTCVQLVLPLRAPPLAIDMGLYPVLRITMRRRLHIVPQETAVVVAIEQRQLVLRLLPPKDRRNTRARYSMELVNEARKMRKFGWTYKEIAETINEHWGVSVAWITVRDWTLNWYRMSR